MMEPLLKGANAVVAAKQLNPTIFHQLWLVDNGIATRDDFLGDSPCVTTQAFAQFMLPSFLLSVVPEQLQFVPTRLDEASGRLVTEKLGRIVELLPQTPYIAAGLNFVWHLVPDGSTLARICRELFFRDNAIFSEFDVPDARFGGYMSMDTLGARLRLDVRPIRPGPTGPAVEELQFAFNYNLDLPRNGREAVEQIINLLGRWDAARKQSSDIVRRVAQAVTVENK